MEHEIAQISAYTNIGITLVLFILLVIVTSIFCYKPDEDNDSSIQSTLDFGLSNESRLYRLRWYSKSGPMNIPERRSLFPGDFDLLTLRLNGVNLQIATVSYRVYYVADLSPTPTLLGEISFQLEGTPGLGVISVLRNTSPASSVSVTLRNKAIYD
ncbi:hypothetical protein M3223_05770 [Paenibacillus pasadenensis]|uniref:hypothetical protein n=1 Tax=Paenibacillus pasadenensis TaxID=217090 RepID=UPI00203ED22C|nr:hypothetical protein [Paenibacillus pasadenensis]MCM3746860.1 hypothetical protein [Paenibacillus pasadenensis]